MSESPDSPTLTALSEAVSTINLGTEDQDVRAFKDLCGSRLDLLQQQYRHFKDSLHRAMTYSTIWWVAHDANNLDQKRRYGTKFIDDIVLPYLRKVEDLIKEHESRFKSDEIVRMYCDFCETGLAKCFSAIEGKTMEHCRTEKGLAVRLARVEKIQEIAKVFRQNFGRKILLERAVHKFDIRHLITKTAKEMSVSSWSSLWSTATREEDVLLWVILPLSRVEKFQLDGFTAVRRERIKVLNGKMELAEDFWEMKVKLEDDPIFDENDDEWASVFETSLAKRFEVLVAEVKLRLMKECNVFNFRFLGHLTDKIVFEEHLHSRNFRGSDKDEWLDFVEYRRALLRGEKRRAMNMQFYPTENTRL